MPEPTPPAKDDTMETQPEPQLIRITNHGKMNTWVAFALGSLEVRLTHLRHCSVLDYTYTLSEERR